MKEKLNRILSGYRVTLPKEFREKFNLEVGDYIKMVWDDKSELRLLPGKVIFKISVEQKEKEG